MTRVRKDSGFTVRKELLIMVIGEGELPFLELCNKINAHQDIRSTDGFLVKQDDRE